MNAGLREGAELVGGSVLVDPAPDCPCCGAMLDSTDVELDLLGSSPLSCRDCGAVLGP